MLVLFKRFGEVPTPVAVSRNVVALAVPALDDQQKPLLGTYVLLPTRDVVTEPLEDLARKAGLAVFETSDGQRIAIAPGAVSRVHTEPGMIGQCVITLGLPNIRPAVVKIGVEAAVEYLNRVSNNETVAPPAPASPLVTL